MRVLVIHDYAYDLDCFLIDRVLKCLNNTGHQAFVISPDNYRYAGLRYSRLYTKWMTCDTGSLDAATINAYCRRRAIDVVMPSDIGSTILLARLQSEISPARTIPLAQPKTIALLHNKWHFGQWLSDHRLPTPETRLLEADTSIDDIDMAFPLIAKPLEASGSKGVQKIDTRDDLRDYAREHRASSSSPFLVQTFIPGEDLVFGVIAEHGTIKAWTIQKYCQDGTRIEFVDIPELLQLGQRIVGGVGHHGVAEFDVRLGVDGSLWFIECNPRFWASVGISMCMGVNLVDLSVRIATNQPLPAFRPATGDYIWPKPLMMKLLRGKLHPSDLSPQNRCGLFYEFSDPIRLAHAWVSHATKTSKA